jgi:proteic killer suppression protein
MEIEINSKFYKGKSDHFHKYCVKKWGADMAKRIEMRLQQASAADDLSVLLPFNAPGRWHWLKEDREGQFSADLVHPQRLLFEPHGGHHQYQSENGAINDDQIRKIVLIDVDDTHN